MDNDTVLKDDKNPQNELFNSIKLASKIKSNKLSEIEKVDDTLR